MIRNKDIKTIPAKEYQGNKLQTHLVIQFDDIKQLKNPQRFEKAFDCNIKYVGKKHPVLSLEFANEEQKESTKSKLKKNSHILNMFTDRKADLHTTPPIYPQAATYDQSRSWQWHLQFTLDDYAQKPNGGPHTLIIDTGIDQEHPDIQGQIHSVLWNDNPMSQGDDAYGHGTSVAGTIIAKNDNLGVAGVNTNAKLSMISICLTMWCDVRASAAIDALYMAADMPDVRIISCSWGFTVYPITQDDIAFIQEIDDCLSYLSSKQKIVIVSVGNDYNHFLYAKDIIVRQLPSDCIGVIGVGSISRTGHASWFTNYNVPDKQFVDIYAPGENMLLPARKGESVLVSGTSFSAPFIAGVASLVLQQHPEYAQTQLLEHLQSTADILPLKAIGGSEQIRVANIARACGQDIDIIQILVQDPFTQRPVPGVTVTLYRNNRLYATALTTHSGIAHIRNPLQETTYTITLQADGYNTYSDTLYYGSGGILRTSYQLSKTLQTYQGNNILFIHAFWDDIYPGGIQQRYIGKKHSPFTSPWELGGCGVVGKVWRPGDKWYFNHWVWNYLENGVVCVFNGSRDPEFQTWWMIDPQQIAGQAYKIMLAQGNCFPEWYAMGWGKWEENNLKVAIYRNNMLLRVFTLSDTIAGDIKTWYVCDLTDETITEKNTLHNVCPQNI